MNESNVAAVRVSVYPDWVLPMTGGAKDKEWATVTSFLGHFNPPSRPARAAHHATSSSDSDSDSPPNWTSSSDSADRGSTLSSSYITECWPRGRPNKRIGGLERDPSSSLMGIRKPEIGDVFLKDLRQSAIFTVVTPADKRVREVE